MDEKIKNSSNFWEQHPFLSFFKEWWIIIVVPMLVLLSRVYLWSPIQVEGHSMDPTLQTDQKMLMIRSLSVHRYDIVVAISPEDQDKKIIKRVIGLPEETVTYDHDQLYIDGVKYPENYLADYKKQFREDKLQKVYSYNVDFKIRAEQAEAFTTSSIGETRFSIKVPKHHYLLLGDDRLISKDSRDPEVGPVDQDLIEGEVKFTFSPMSKFGFVKHGEK